MGKKKEITKEQVEAELEQLVKQGLLVKRWNNVAQEFTYQDAKYAPKRTGQHRV